MDAVIAFGRMNPPTTGHQLVVNTMRSIADCFGVRAKLFLSHVCDHDRNPLTYQEKVVLASEAFGQDVDVVISPANGIVQVVETLGVVDRLIIVAGSDRAEHFAERVLAYNDKLYSVSSLGVVSAGPRREGGVSGTLARSAATDGNWELFQSLLAPGLSDQSKLFVYERIRNNAIRIEQ